MVNLHYRYHSQTHVGKKIMTMSSESLLLSRDRGFTPHDHTMGGEGRGRCRGLVYSHLLLLLRRGRKWVEGNESFGLYEASVLRCALVGVLREILPPPTSLQERGPLLNHMC